jgi:hypothetical protein
MIRYLLIFIFLCPSAWSTTFYITKTGNDSDSGKTWAAAFLTVDKLNDSMTTGDTALFGTGTWYSSSIKPPSGTSSDSTWTVYACSTFVHNNNDAEKLAGKHLPKIWGGEEVTGWTDTTVGGNTVWKTTWAGTDCYKPAGYTYELCYTLGQIDNDSLLYPGSTIDSVNRAGRFFKDTVNGQLYAWCWGGGDPDGHGMIASCKPPVYMAMDDYDHIRFWGLDFRYGSGAVIWLNAKCDTIYIEHCHVAKVGWDYFENPAVIFSGNSNEKSGEFNHIIACSLGWAINEDKEYCHGGVIEMYSQEHVYVESCYVYGYCNMGVCWKNYPNNVNGPFTGNVVRYNTIKANRVCVQIGTNPDRDSIYGNVLIGFVEGYSGNTGYTGYTGINITSTGPMINDYIGSTFVCNNTFYNIRDRFMRLHGESNADCGAFRNNTVKYNVCYEYVDSGHYEIPYFMGFDYAPGDCDTAYLIDSNMYYDPETSFDCNCKTEESIYDWNYWQGTCGADSNGTCDVDPNLNDPANGDFSRPTAYAGSHEMDRTYGGQTWYYLGAIQDSTEAEETGRFLMKAGEHGGTATRFIIGNDP